MALVFMRRHRRWLYAFLWVVILGFIVFYIPAFQGLDAGSPAEPLASVGGVTISAGEFQRAYLRRRQEFERLSRSRLDPAMLRSLGIPEQILSELVAERIVLLEARRLGLSVHDETLARRLSGDPRFLRDGRFVGVNAVRRYAEAQGMTLEQFEEDYRSRLLREALASLVTAGVGVSPAEAEREFRRRNEQIKVEYVLVDAARLQASASDEEVRARFEARREAYRIPERRVVSYALLDTEAMKARVTVTDREIDAYYADHREDFREEEQVCASHILVKVKTGEGGEGHSEEEAKRIAQGLLDRVRPGADFAAVARKSSEDKGSAEKGGDLGCFPRGVMKLEFEDAAFSLKPGETSDLVKTDFGYHVIRVASRREEAVPPLAQVKDRIRQLVLDEKLQALVEERAAALSEALRRGRRLEEASREQGVPVHKSPPVARGEAVEGLSSPTLVARAFELKPGETDPQPFAVPRGHAFVSLLEVQPSRLPELGEVQERVKADLLEEKALERARAVAAELKARAARMGLETAAAALGLVRKETPSLVGRGEALGELGAGLALEEAAYSLPARTLSGPVRAAGGYVVLRVLEKKPFDPVAFEKEKASLTAALREAKKAQFLQAFMNNARQRVPIEIRTDVFRRLVG